MYFEIFSLLAVGGLVGLLLIFAFFDQARLVRSNTLFQLPTDEMRVALTFDDGPSPEWTPKVLSLLDQLGVKATFFLLGSNVLKYPELVRRIVDSGHAVGNHGFAHDSLWCRSNSYLIRDISEASASIRKVSGISTDLFRPPKGLLRNSQKRALQKLGYKVVLWSLNSKDWAGFSSKWLQGSLDKRLNAGDIILLHDGGGVFASTKGDRSATIEALRHLIPVWKSRGFRFVNLYSL